MNIYDAFTHQLLTAPDLSAGYLVEGVIVTGYTNEVMSDTVTEYRPNGIRHRVPVTEPCQWYYPNPSTASEPAEKTIDEKISDAVTVAVALAQGGL